MNYQLRPAQLNEQTALAELIGRSLRALSEGYYSVRQVEGALRSACAVDTQLIRDGTYYVVEDEKSRIAGCGGWSYRKTLFGGDTHHQRDALCLDPRTEAAKIRAFFIAPEHARRGLALMLLRHCEEQALAQGFTRLELMSTLPGVPFYQKQGFVGLDAIDHPLPNGESIPFLPMTKTIG